MYLFEAYSLGLLNRVLIGLQASVRRCTGVMPEAAELRNVVALHVARVKPSED